MRHHRRSGVRRWVRGGGRQWQEALFAGASDASYSSGNAATVASLPLQAQVSRQRLRIPRRRAQIASIGMARSWKPGTDHVFCPISLKKHGLAPIYGQSSVRGPGPSQGPFGYRLTALHDSVTTQDGCCAFAHPARPRSVDQELASSNSEKMTTALSLAPMRWTPLTIASTDAPRKSVAAALGARVKVRHHSRSGASPRPDFANLMIPKPPSSAHHGLL